MNEEKSHDKTLFLKKTIVIFPQSDEYVSAYINANKELTAYEKEICCNWMMQSCTASDMPSMCVQHSFCTQTSWITN